MNNSQSNIPAEYQGEYMVCVFQDLNNNTCSALPLDSSGISKNEDFKIGCLMGEKLGRRLIMIFYKVNIIFASKAMAYASRIKTDKKLEEIDINLNDILQVEVKTPD